MTTSLHATIASLAADFATSLLHAMKQMSLDEIVAQTRGGSKTASKTAPRPMAKMAKATAVVAPVVRKAAAKNGRLGRRTAADITAVVERIVAVLASKPMGLRAEQIRDALGLQSKEMPRPIADALSARLIVKTGEKRATTYFARNAAPNASAKGKSSKPAKNSGNKAAKGGKRAAGAGAAA